LHRQKIVGEFIDVGIHLRQFAPRLLITDLFITGIEQSARMSFNEQGLTD
jgi:hypothetical protein